MHILLDLQDQECHAEQHGQAQPDLQVLAIVLAQRMVRPGQRRARQKQDHGVVERQVQRIENLNALRRPDAACERGARYLMHFIREEACIEERPKPRHEEHNFRGDEHDHAVAQMQRHDAGMVALMPFLDRISPPAIHAVKHDREADEEYPRRHNVEAEERQLTGIDVTHPGNTADGKHECTHRAQERPRTGRDNMIVVIFLMNVGHVSPRKSP